MVLANHRTEQKEEDSSLSVEDGLFSRGRGRPKADVKLNITEAPWPRKAVKNRRGLREQRRGQAERKMGVPGIYPMTPQTQ